PVLVVSYNDTQGNHKFITELELQDLAVDLSTYDMEMIREPELRLDSLDEWRFDDSNKVFVSYYNPSRHVIKNAQLSVVFAPASGTLDQTDNLKPVVAAFKADRPVIVKDLSPGLNRLTEWGDIIPSDFFPPDADATEGYSLVAMVRDAQGSVIDTAVRRMDIVTAEGTPSSPHIVVTPQSLPLDSDPLDSKVVTQGDLVPLEFTILNAGLSPLEVVVGTHDRSIVVSEDSAEATILPGSQTTVSLSVDTSGDFGAYDRYVYVASNDPDPDKSLISIHITGTVVENTEQAKPYDIPGREWAWEKRVFVKGPHAAGDVVQFDYSQNLGIQLGPENIHPLYVFHGTALVGKGQEASPSDFMTWKDGTDTGVRFRVPYDIAADDGESFTFKFGRVLTSAGGGEQSFRLQVPEGQVKDAQLRLSIEGENEYVYDDLADGVRDPERWDIPEKSGTWRYSEAGGFTLFVASDARVRSSSAHLVSTAIPSFCSSLTFYASGAFLASTTLDSATASQSMRFGDAVLFAPEDRSVFSPVQLSDSIVDTDESGDMVYSLVRKGNNLWDVYEKVKGKYRSISTTDSTLHVSVASSAPHGNAWSQIVVGPITCIMRQVRFLIRC
ncbi:MAG: hypothetical protein FJY85_09820, partial [Deltaproteobacteria bacterium]|nr:hypothetical protein [Deltaproteobacteria bacterium]